MKRSELREIIMGGSQLLILGSGLSAAMMDVLPLLDKNSPVPGAFFFDPKPPTYKDITNKALEDLKVSLLGDIPEVCLTDDFVSDSLPDNAIAYHRIFGFITAASRWWFSSKQFERDLLAVEKNPSFGAHFLHINSPGGEAWYLDRLSETMQQLTKPVIALIERQHASAAVYISCHAAEIYSLTQNDIHGCIGTMTDFWNSDAYFEQLGFKHIIVRAKQSDLKNKKYQDLYAGKTEQYQTDELNPLAVQFIAEVRANRPKIAALPDNDPMLRGETFDTPHSIELGLIDGMKTFAEAVQRAHEMAVEFGNKGLLNKALKYI